MDQSLYLCIVGLMAALAVAAFILFRVMSKSKEKTPPQLLMGAIRVTDREGRDMLIIRKEDGSFEMHEEQEIRKRCAS
jgi:hypothetical protein